MIYLDKHSLKELAEKAKKNILEHRKDCQNNLINTNNKLKKDYNSLSFWKKIFKDAPLDHPKDYHMFENYEMYDGWTYATEVSEVVICLCDTILNASKEKTVRIVLTNEEYDNLKYWSEAFEEKECLV